MNSIVTMLNISMATQYCFQSCSLCGSTPKSLYISRSNGPHDRIEKRFAVDVEHVAQINPQRFSDGHKDADKQKKLNPV